MKNGPENQELELQIPAPMREAWQKTLESIETLVRPQYFQSFILTIRLLEARENCLVLGFPDRFSRDWVYDHYSSLIHEKFDEASHKKFKLEYTVEQKKALETKAAKPAQVAPAPARKAVPAPKSGQGSLAAETVLNTKYGFETFVVGGSNQFAHAASFTVTEAPGRHYNPLFIYGDVGLGKTHLLNAIGLKIQERFPQLRVHYTTFEKFTNHMIESIRFERMEEFRDRYRRNCDV